VKISFFFLSLGFFSSLSFSPLLRRGEREREERREEDG